EPISIAVETFGTGLLPQERLAHLIRDHFDLTPHGIIQSLNLIRPIYRQTAAYGHFGRNEPDLTWEALDKVEILKDAADIRHVRRLR
ncbi:S-adenosylmethionine synthetase, partial [mine drainage metagenome]